MSSLLKGRKLWCFVTSHFPKPTKQKDEDDNKYLDRLEDWDSKNHQIITWLQNTSIPSIHLQFGQFETIKAVWDHLAQRYTSSDLSHRFQLIKELSSLKQDKGQPVYDFLAQMEVIWNQLTLSEPVWKDVEDAAKFVAYRNGDRLIQFLMALTDDYEPVRAALLNQQPLPTLEAALPRLKSEETRLGLLKTQVDVAFIASDKNDKICRTVIKLVIFSQNAPLLNVVNAVKRDILPKIVLQYFVDTVRSLIILLTIV